MDETPHDSSRKRELSLPKLEFVDLAFIARMEHEIHANAEQKGNWLEWDPTVHDAIDEVLYHVSKLKGALTLSNVLDEDDRHHVTEYSADIANYAMKIAMMWGIIPELPPVIAERRAHVCTDLLPEQKKEVQRLADESHLSVSNWLEAVIIDAIKRQQIFRKTYTEVPQI